MGKKMENKKQKLELTWIGKDEELRLEPRILIENPEKSYGDPKSENMLIHGDNLLALKALEQGFSGRIKCIYIDPPYNTGNAFEHFDDGLEHSIWLNLMKPRLEMLTNLLAPEGVILVHIDDNEQAYLKVLMDEIFYRSNFVNCIAIRDSHPSGLKLSAKDKKIIKTKSYILVYKKSDQLIINPIYQSRDDWDTHYSIYIDIDRSTLVKESLRDVLLREGVLSKNDQVNEYSLKNASFRKFCFENRNKIFQSTKEMPEDVRELSLKKRDEIIEYFTDK